jgi:tetratricopeptide (TPR) repeat protein
MVVLRRLAVWAALVLALTPPSLAHARWLRAESPLFIVYSDGGETDLRKVTDRLERYDAFLRLLTGTTEAYPKQKMTVYLVAGSRTLNQIWPDAPPTVLGFYSAAASGIAAVAIRAEGESLMINAQQVLFHEYAHHFMLQYYPGAYPTWYQEGFAEFCSTVDFTPQGVEFGRAVPNRMMWLSSHPWMPVEKLFAPPSPKVLHEEMFYPQAWLATHYLLQHPREQEKMKRYLVALRHGETPAPAFQKAFGMDFAAFQKVLAAYYSKGTMYARLKLPTEPAATSITVNTMPPSADRLLLDHARLVSEHVSDKDKATFAAQVRSDAALFPDDPLALRTLALAEILAGDPAAADAPLDKLLQASPDDLEGLYLKGLRSVMAGWKDPDNRAAWFHKAQPSLVRAYRVDPHYAPTLWLLGVSLGANGGRPSDNELNAVTNAHLLAPQVGDFAMSAAEVMMRAERYAEAAEILEQVVYAPHGQGGGEKALKMLQDAKGHLSKPASEPAAAAP